MSEQRPQFKVSMMSATGERRFTLDSDRFYRAIEIALEFAGRGDDCGRLARAIMDAAPTESVTATPRERPEAPAGAAPSSALSAGASSTPRTDAQISVHDEADPAIGGTAGYNDLVEHARDLERELAEVRAALSVATADAGQVAMMLLLNDRDGAMQWARDIELEWKTDGSPRLKLRATAMPSATAASIDEPVDERDWFTKLKKAQPATAERMFPMQDGPAIPWSLAEVIWQGYAALFGKGQKLERVGERGGFGWAEVAHFWSKPKAREAMKLAAADRTEADRG